ncbi:MAG: hypothetical protein AAFV88_01635 [Planctomycetota bacterium]
MERSTASGFNFANNPAPESMTDSASTHICPFCIGHCDGLVVDATGRISTDCRSAETTLVNIESSNRTRIGDRHSDEIPWESIRSRLETQEAVPPIVEFGSVSIQQAKLVCDWLEQGKLRVALAEDDSIVALGRTIARDGGCLVTLADAARFSDQMVFIGDVASASGVKRQLRVDDDQSIELDTISADQLSRWHAALATGEFGSDGETLRQTLTSSYVTWVVLPGAFPVGDETVASELLVGLCERLQRVTDDDSRLRRSVLLYFDDHTTLRTVYRWRSNQSLPVARGPGLVRVGCFHPPRDRVLLQIGGVDPGEDLAECFIPARMLGLETAGTVIRGDGSVTLPLSAVRASPHPDAFDALAKLLVR